MNVAITGGTGFVGRHIVDRLGTHGHQVRGWHRASSDLTDFQFPDQNEWIAGSLTDGDCESLLHGCDALVHSAFWRPGAGFRGAEGDLEEFVRVNVVGTVRLFEAARRAGVRTVFISSCAVHEEILDDRPLDESHPTWAKSHYGAHKAALEQFVYSYGLGHGVPICCLRPCGVYGPARPIETSRWFELVRDTAHGKIVQCEGGGKVVHASDVAAAVERLLLSDESNIAGQAFNCCERYVSQWQVAHAVKALTNSQAEIRGQDKTPKHQIQCGKLEALGFKFGGEPIFCETLSRLIEAAR